MALVETRLPATNWKLIITKTQKAIIMTTHHLVQAQKLNPKFLIDIAPDNQLTTDSIKVAAAFNREHKNVLQSIDKLDCSQEFASANFSAHEEIIQAGAVRRKSKIYKMTKDGFMFLVMGFTGKQAGQIKEAYINAFDQMWQQLYGDPRRAMPKPLKFKGTRVLLLKHIDRLHGRKEGHASRRFYQYQPELYEGCHYYRLTEADLKTIEDQGYTGCRAHTVLITEAGYLELVKGFREADHKQNRKQVLEGYYISRDDMRTPEPRIIDDRPIKALKLVNEWASIRAKETGSQRAIKLGEWGLRMEAFTTGKTTQITPDNTDRSSEAEQILIKHLKNEANKTQDESNYAGNFFNIWIEGIAWAKRWNLSGYKIENPHPASVAAQQVTEYNAPILAADTNEQRFIMTVDNGDVPRIVPLKDDQFVTSFNRLPDVLRQRFSIPASTLRDIITSCAGLLAQQSMHYQSKQQD